jgi:hypothetical protein
MINSADDVSLVSETLPYLHSPLSGILFAVVLLHFASLLFELQRECKLTSVAKENIPLMIKNLFSCHSSRPLLVAVT